MSEIKWEAIQASLSAPFPKETIQRTKKEDTRKAYDTSGIGYQHLVNRFNDVLGNQWGYEYEVLKTTEGTFRTGTPYFDITVKLTIWCLSPNNGRTLVGGHISANYADALKGSITNAFKKTASMWGVGREAYEGTLDDDNEPPEKTKEEKTKKDIKGEGVGDKKLPDKDSPKAETDLKTKTEPKIEEPKKEEKKEPVGGTKTYLTFDDLKKKMATAKNKFELQNRCKKYRPDYDQQDKEHQTFIIIERDKRLLWLTKGEGTYEDLETKGINKEG